MTIVHQPAAARGPNNNGVPGLPCAACHTDRNLTLPTGEARYRSIPGGQRWGLAPIEMAWEGRSVSDICHQMKDPTRNGGRSLALLHDHIATDDLVGWGVAAQCWPATCTGNSKAARRPRASVDRFRRRAPAEPKVELTLLGTALTNSPAGMAAWALSSARGRRRHFPR
jgi:hypothetical protein